MSGVDENGGVKIMEIRKLKENDLDKVMEIYKVSREFMAANGNPNQWGDNYLNRESIKSHINNDGYVVVSDGEVVGVFVLQDYEPVYDSIDGSWLNDELYGVIHRLASGGTHKGVGQFILDWCLNKTGNIRIDTHEDNVPMLKLLKKNGYTYCGKVSFGEHGERMAFQKIKVAD